MLDGVLRTAIRLVPFVGLVGTIITTIVDASTPGGDLGRDLLENSVLWMPAYAAHRQSIFGAIWIKLLKKYSIRIALRSEADLGFTHYFKDWTYGL